MKTQTFKTPKQVIKATMDYARAFAVAFDCNWIESDMAVELNVVQECAEAMKTDGKFSFEHKCYIRSMGVEDSMERVKALNDEVAAVATVGYDKVSKEWFLTTQKVFKFGKN